VISGILTRLLQGLGVMLVVGLLAFAVSTKLGDPVNNMLGQNATTEEREAMRRELGLDQPFVVQYGRYLARVAHGQLGVSYRLGIPVGELLRERLPASVELSGVAMLLTLLVGVPLGVYTAIRQLRRMGLAPYLITRDDGYVIPASLHVQWVTPPRR